MRISWLAPCGLLAFLLSALLLPGLSIAENAPPLRLHDDMEETRLEPYVTWYCDDSGQLGLTDIISRQRVLAHDAIVFGYEKGACWFHFSLSNTTHHTQSLILELDHPILDSVELFAPGDPTHDYLKMGDSLPFNERPLLTRSYSVPLELAPGSERDYYLKISSSSSIIVPLSLSTTEQYIAAQERTEWVMGAGFGITCGLILYHLFLWVAVKEKIYRFYVLYMGTALFYLLCIEGVAYELWPLSPWWNAHAQLLFVSSMLASGSLFARDYLRTADWPRADHVLKILAGICGLAVVAQFFLPLSLGYQLQPLLALLTMTCIITIAVQRWRNGLREARLFLLSWGMLLGMAVLISLQSFGVFPALPFVFVLNGMEIAFILQQLLLALALADRLNILKQENDRQQAATMQAEAENAAKTEFLARMSHEIRTPMNALMGITQLLQDTRLDSVQKNYVDTLNSSGHALLNVINDILDYSKITAGKVELEHADFNLPELLAECIQIFSLSAREKSLSLTCVQDSQLPVYVRGDAGRLRQILLNLLSNAIKFTEYGRVQLRVRVQERSASRVRLGFEVEDSGIGIAAEKIPLLFESFMQADSSSSRRYGGTGLGLAISRQLVELMHGQISASSTPGVGSVFRFNVLLKTAQAPSGLNPEQDPGDISQLFAGIMALVVEDNPINQLVIQGFLQKTGMAARVVSSGQEALDLLVAGSMPFDIIFMDCEMPLMDGFETTRRLRHWEQETGCPPHLVIALTAHALPEHRVRCLEAGMNDYLSKPLLLPRLIEKLNGLLPRKLSGRHGA